MQLGSERAAVEMNVASTARSAFKDSVVIERTSSCVCAWRDVNL